MSPRMSLPIARARTSSPQSRLRPERPPARGAPGRTRACQGETRVTQTCVTQPALLAPPRPRSLSAIPDFPGFPAALRDEGDGPHPAPPPPPPPPPPPITITITITITSHPDHPTPIPITENPRSSSPDGRALPGSHRFSPGSGAGHGDSPLDKRPWRHTLFEKVGSSGPWAPRTTPPPPRVGGASHRSIPGSS